MHNPWSLDRARAELESSHRMLERFIADFTPAQAIAQPHPSHNHLLWQLGHLALDYRWFAAAIDGKPEGNTPEQRRLFGMGSTPVPDAAAYPALAALRTDLDAAWERMLAAARGLTAEDAGKAPASGTTELNDRLDAITKCTWHNGWHTGQIAALRRGLGMKGAW